MKRNADNTEDAMNYGYQYTTKTYGGKTKLREFRGWNIVADAARAAMDFVDHSVVSHFVVQEYRDGNALANEGRTVSVFRQIREHVWTGTFVGAKN